MPVGILNTSTDGDISLILSVLFLNIVLSIIPFIKFNSFQIIYNIRVLVHNHLAVCYMYVHTKKCKFLQVAQACNFLCEKTQVHLLSHTISMSSSIASRHSIAQMGKNNFRHLLYIQYDSMYNSVCSMSLVVM